MMLHAILLIAHCPYHSPEHTQCWYRAATKHPEDLVATSFTQQLSLRTAHQPSRTPPAPPLYIAPTPRTSAAARTLTSPPQPITPRQPPPEAATPAAARIASQIPAPTPHHAPQYDIHHSRPHYVIPRLWDHLLLLYNHSPSHLQQQVLRRVVAPLQGAQQWRKMLGHSILVGHLGQRCHPPLALLRHLNSTP